jgi:translation initiation factor IF-1
MIKLEFQNMPKPENTFELDGVVSEALPNTMFRVTINEDALDDWAGKTILCTLAGKMRMYKIRVMPGDKVKVQVTIYDQKRGRISFRYK